MERIDFLSGVHSSRSERTKTENECRGGIFIWMVDLFLKYFIPNN